MSANNQQTESQTAVSPASKQLKAILSTIVLIGLIAYLGFRIFSGGEQVEQAAPHNVESGPPSAVPKGHTVSIGVDFGNGTRWNFSKLAWREGLTGADAMKMASKSRPGLSYIHDGNGELDFLVSISSIKSEGQGGRNWILYLNGKASQLGYGAIILKPNDAILWKFEEYEYNEASISPE